MSLLTKEQADAVWRARVGVKCEVGKQWTPAADINALLSIIDDLQARAHIIDCEFCDGTGGFQNEQTGEITDCRRCKGSGKHVLAPRQYTEQELFKSIAFEVLRSDDYNDILDHVDKRMAKYENTNAN